MNNNIVGNNPHKGNSRAMAEDYIAGYNWPEFPSPPTDMSTYLLYQHYESQMTSSNLVQNVPQINIQPRIQFNDAKQMQKHPYRTPSTSPETVLNFNVMATYDNATESYKSSTPAFWPIKVNNNVSIRRSSAYSTGSDDSRPRSLSSPEQPNSPTCNALPDTFPSLDAVTSSSQLMRRQVPLIEQTVEPFGHPLMATKNESGTSYSPNSPCQQSPSQSSPSTSQAPSIAEKIAAKRQKRQVKKVKKDLNNIEILQQNAPAKSSSEQFYQPGEYQYSPNHPSTSTENHLQEQIYSKEFCQAEQNASDPNSTNRDAASPSGSSLTSAGNGSAKKPKIIKEVVALTEEVYRTEPGYMVPRYDAKGAIKKTKCKKNGCQLLFATKHELWIHTRVHLPEGKIFECEQPYCTFVTAHNHHLEYHNRLHTGYRPFYCSKCPYTATNKASLTSHEKSHTDFPRYFCGECLVNTKYEHTLKQHLRKDNHKPGKCFDKHGNEMIGKVIDVTGMKRGPKMNKNVQTPRPANQRQEPTGNTIPISHNYLFQTLHQEKLAEIQNLGRMDSQMEGGSPIAGRFLSQDLSMIAANASAVQYAPSIPVSEIPLDLSTSAAMNVFATEEAAVADSMEILPQEVEEAQVLNLSIKNSNNITPSNTGRRSGTNKRKGKAVKYVCPQKQYEMRDDDDANNKAVNPIAVNNFTPTSNNRCDNFECEFCQVSFGQLVMFSDHMKYHSQEDPSVCNICKERFSNQAEFYLHIGRDNHSQYQQ